MSRSELQISVSILKNNTGDLPASSLPKTCGASGVYGIRPIGRRPQLQSSEARDIPHAVFAVRSAFTGRRLKEGHALVELSAHSVCGDVARLLGGKGDANGKSVADVCKWMGKCSRGGGQVRLAEVCGVGLVYLLLPPGKLSPPGKL